MRRLENFIARPKGGVSRRPGLRFVGEVADSSHAVRLLPFEFNTAQAYVLVFGHQTLQIVTDGAFLPVLLTTPYDAAHLFGLQTAQSADVMWIVHPSYPPYKLLRFSDSQWSLQPVAFDPAPSTEVPFVVAPALTLAALTGTDVQITAASALWLEGDVGRVLTLAPSEASQARAVVRSVTSTTVARLTILVDFPSLSLPAGAARLSPTPAVAVKPVHITSDTEAPEYGIKGRQVRLRVYARSRDSSEILTNGDFSSGLTGWTNYSASGLATGTHTGGTGTDLQDTAKHFPALGIRVGMRAVNTTSSQQGEITVIKPDGHALTVGITFNNGDGYRLEGTGGVEAVGGGAASLAGGAAGLGWIEQGISTVAGNLYRLTFDVAEGPLSVMIGTAAQTSDLAAEATYAIGNQREVIWTARSTTSYVSFRNNQPTTARVVNASVKEVSVDTWRTQDILSQVKLNGGVVEIQGLANPTTAIGLIRKPLTSDADALAGTWSLAVPAWSASQGYPRTVSFHQQRLAFAGTASQPLTVWMSVSGEYDNFGPGELADDGLEHEISANKMNVLLWLEPFRDLLMGTAAGEHLLRGVNGPLTPSNGEQLPQTSVGSAELRPIRHDNALIMLQRGARQLMELTTDDVGAVVRGPDLTLYADHITESGLAQLAMQTKPLAILWAVRSDGQLIGLTYEQIEQVRGWHRHVTQGAFESVCVVPLNQPIDAETEAVYVVVRRTVQGQTRRAVERLDPALTLDSALSYSGALTTTLSGLEHLAGLTVQIVDRSSGQAAVRPDQVVSASGTVSLTPGVTRADVGLGYTSTLETLRPEIPLRDGTLQGRKQRWLKIMARLLDSVGLTINGWVVPFREPADAMDAGIPPRDRDVELVNLGWNRDGRIVLEQRLPLPSTVLALVGLLEVEDSA